MFILNVYLLFLFDDHGFILFYVIFKSRMNNTSFCQAIQYQYQGSSIAIQYQCNTNAILDIFTLDAVKYVIEFPLVIYSI